MFKVSFAPQVRADKLEVLKEGDTLIINGDALDFSGLPDGGEYPVEAIDNEFVVGVVKRIDGVIHITVALPYGDLQWHGANSDQLAVIIDQDGPVALPDGRYPPPVELFPPQQPAEGEADANQ